MYHTALPLLALTIPPPSQPLPTPHLFHLTPPPTHTHTLYTLYITQKKKKKMINVFSFFYSHYMCNGFDLYIDTR